MKINKNPLLGIPIPYIDFGDGRKIECIDSTKIPAIIVSHKFDMVTNVVDSDISLFSKSSMKRANMKLKFWDGTKTIFNQIPLSWKHKTDIIQSQLPR